MKPAGGEATVIIKGGEEKFEGSSKNGVSSAGWSRKAMT